jgi:hypothetical protein
MRTRLAGRMTFTAEYRSPDLGMKRDVIMLPAVIANDVESLRRIISRCGFFSTAFRTTLRRHHITLVKHLLFLFSEQEDLFTLHTRDLYIRHR